MKTTKSLIVGANLAAVGALAFAVSGDITGTAHDFSGTAWETSGEICRPCHIPHNSNTTVDQAPLWNHEITTAVYQTHGAGYDPLTFSPDPNNNGVDIPAAEAIDGTSLLCMGCHDGTVALDSYGGTAGSTFLTNADDGYIGTDLVDDHPIGADAVYSDYPWMIDPTLWEGIRARKFTLRDMFVPADAATVGVVSCGTCHEPHNGGEAAAQARPYLLQLDNSGSSMCLECHNK